MQEPVFYFDTSALVKRYWVEKGTELVNSIYDFKKSRNSKLYTAKHSIPEFVSAAMRLKRENRFTSEEANGYVNAFLFDSQNSIVFIELDDEIYYRSVDMLIKHTLKASDAIHLSAAVDLLQNGIDLHFVCADHQLCNAAESEGLHVLNPMDVEIMEFFSSL